MGGYRGGKNTTDYYNALDVRWLYRERFLGCPFLTTLSWSRGGEVIASIGVRNRAGNLLLEYSVSDGSAGRQQLSYPVEIDWTPCHYGGKRPWFLCPARGCGRRVAVLYGGRIFACRQCHDLAYECQHEPPHGRALQRAQKIRRRLGGSSNMSEEFPDKPKGMHWRTYESLCRQYETALLVVSLDAENDVESS